MDEDIASTLGPYLGNDEQDSIAPKQSLTISSQIATVQASSGLPDCPSFQIQLNVDAGPGCGGIAWPAGAVRSFLSLDMKLTADQLKLMQFISL